MTMRRTDMVRGPARSLAILTLTLGAAACGDCGGDEDPTPVVPETTGQGSTFNSFGTEEEDATEAPPPRPEIVHEDPPTLEDFAVDAVQGNWTTWRGDQDRTGLRETRPIRTPRIKWSIQVGIQGYANTPIVTDDTIYVASQGDLHQRDDERDGVFALEPDTGAIRWHYDTERDANGLTLAGDVLLVGTDGRRLIAVDANTGDELWRVEQDCQIYHAPAVRDGNAYLIRNDEVGHVAIDIATGNVVEGTLDCVRSERGAISVDDERVYRAGVRAASATDALGVAWEDEAVVGQLRARTRWAPPLLTENMVINAVHGWPFGEEGAIDLRPAAVARWQDDGQIAWVIDVNDPAHANPEPPVRDTAFLRSQPWVANDRLFWTPTNAGALVAYDVQTGERLEQVRFPDCRNRAFGSIVGTPQMGYYARHDGMLYGFTTAPLGIAWQVSLGLHAAAGTRATHYPVQGPCSAHPKDSSALFATPAIGPDGTLYVGSGDGWLYAIADSGW